MSTPELATSYELAQRKPQPLMSLDDVRADAPKSFTRTEFMTVYPQFDNDQKRDKARLNFFRDDMSLEDIAINVDVPFNTVIAWAHCEDWVKRKSIEVKTRQAEEKLKLDKIRLERRVQIVRDQLDTSSKLRERIDQMVDDADTPSQLKMIAEAAKNISDTETRALGIADDGSVSNANDDPENGPNAKRPLVVVFGGNTGLPPIRRHTEVIDVSP